VARAHVFNSANFPKICAHWHRRITVPKKLDLKTQLVLGTVAMLIALPAFGEPNPDKDSFYGETHVHTSWSFDAYIFGNTVTTPADAYKYAKGEPITHPMGYEIKITTPLDWMGVTDHSEYVGVIQETNDPNSSLSKIPIAENLKVRDKADIQRVYTTIRPS
jgi:hypothetical protein